MTNGNTPQTGSASPATRPRPPLCVWSSGPCIASPCHAPATSLPHTQAPRTRLAGNPLSYGTVAGHASSILKEGSFGPGFQGLPILTMGRSTGATSDRSSHRLWPCRPASRLVSGRSRHQGRRCDPSGRQSRSGPQSLRRRGQAAGALGETRPLPTTMPSVGREWGQQALCMPTVVPSRSVSGSRLNFKV